MILAWACILAAGIPILALVLTVQPIEFIGDDYDEDGNRNNSDKDERDSGDIL